MYLTKTKTMNTGIRRRETEHGGSSEFDLRFQKSQLSFKSVIYVQKPSRVRANIQCKEGIATGNQTEQSGGEGARGMGVKMGQKNSVRCTEQT
jgi:hypothetical protein